MSIEKGRMRLTDLARRAGVPLRTVRYYVQRGLLPAPRFRGPDTAYDEPHLLRLQAIRRLQERFFPLDAIQVELGRMTPDAIRALAQGGEPPSLAAAMVAPGPASAVAGAAGSSAWERWELAPGLELHLSQAAPAPSRALAEKLCDTAKNAAGGASNEH